MIAVTGATGQLGSLVVEALLKTVPANQIIAAVRTPAKAKAFADKGVQVREADYNRPETLAPAFAGVTKLLLISGNELGQRVPQHKAAIDAAKAAGVKLIAYTSLLKADTSPLKLAAEHLATEQYLQASGVSYVFLRNGWYTENMTAAIPSALQQGAFIGSTKEGRIAGASRADYAEAAAAVLSTEGHNNTIYELAGDTSFTRAELAAEVSKQSGKTIGYHDLPAQEYEKILATFLPHGLAPILADAEAHAADGALDDTSHTLSKLIGHPTEPLATTVANALKSL